MHTGYESGIRGMSSTMHSTGTSGKRDKGYSEVRAVQEKQEV